ncbi:Hypothetical predicted protein [Scomber scombrus]|uniref:Uncharacterized protein n=1 Tax=Scomber scombrus TaxID=13677 RepID=A0AAV1NXG9_SCOSC
MSPPERCEATTAAARLAVSSWTEKQGGGGGAHIVGARPIIQRDPPRAVLKCWVSPNESSSECPRPTWVLSSKRQHRAVGQSRPHKVLILTRIGSLFFHRVPLTHHV